MRQDLGVMSQPNYLVAMILCAPMMLKGRIDKNSPIPYYYQLKQIIVGGVEEGSFEPGDRLPSEHDLCRTFGVSRTVVRQALAELETEGWLRRQKGRGAFVAPKKATGYIFQGLTGLYEDVTARGSTLRSDVRRLERIPASASVAKELGLDEGDPVIVLGRLRYVDGVPWVSATAYLPYDLCPGLLKEDLTNQSLYSTLENKYGVNIDHGRRSVEAVRVPAAVARALGIKYGAPVLLLHGTAYDDQGRAIEHFVEHHRGDLSRFEVNLVRHRRENGREVSLAPMMVAQAAVEGNGTRG